MGSLRIVTIKQAVVCMVTALVCSLLQYALGGDQEGCAYMFIILLLAFTGMAGVNNSLEE